LENVDEGEEKRCVVLVCFLEEKKRHEFI